MKLQRHSLNGLRVRRSMLCIGVPLLALALSPVRLAAQSDGQPASSAASPAQTTANSTSATSESPLAALELARRSIEKYFEHATNVVCLESVTQSILNKAGKSTYKEESSFEYQLQSGPSGEQGGALHLVESRATRKASFRDPARTLLITSGFSSMLLVVHPDYEPSYAFETAGEEAIDGIAFLKFNFRPIPGAASPAALHLRGRSYPLPLSGSVWIDPHTGLIAKLVAEVDSSLSDVGLKGMRSEIQYASVNFRDPEETYWMPVSAAIDVETPRQHWRNVHRFTNYRRFRATILVGTESKP